MTATTVGPGITPQRLLNTRRAQLWCEGHRSQQMGHSLDPGERDEGKEAINNVLSNSIPRNVDLACLMNLIYIYAITEKRKREGT
jgi:hypothetical protein